MTELKTKTAPTKDSVQTLFFSVSLWGPATLVEPLQVRLFAVSTLQWSCREGLNYLKPEKYLRKSVNVFEPFYRQHTGYHLIDNTMQQSAS